METTCTISAGNGQTVEMIGNADTLDKIAMQMRTHAGLVGACQMALDYLLNVPYHPDNNEGLAISRLIAAIAATVPPNNHPTYKTHSGARNPLRMEIRSDATYGNSEN